MKSLKRLPFGPLAVAGVLLFAQAARAEPSFPAAVQDALNLSCTPDCTLCHLTSPGLPGNYTQPFGLTVLGKVGTKLVLLHPETITATLDAIDADGKDSDGDGTPDIVELRALRNPSVKGPNDPLCSGLKYGCGAHVARRSSVDHLGLASALLMVLGLGVVTLRRRMR